MIAAATRTEVIHHGLERRKRRGAVSPDISAVRFLLSGLKDLQRRLIGVHNLLRQYGLSKGIDQRQKLYTGLSDPLGQR